MIFSAKQISPFLLCWMLVVSLNVYAEVAFPKIPELTVTPGKLCDKPSSRRYAESIAYCERDVIYQTKKLVIETYDNSFGYAIGKMNRVDFKIDLLIPLCVGGSNDQANLWPQHKSSFVITDPFEYLVCTKMSLGKLKQNNAVLIILEGKTHLDRVPQLIRQLKSL
jgi:hypothetical protein